MDQRLLLKILPLRTVKEHFRREYQCFVKFYKGVNGSPPTHHANGVLAIDGLPLHEEERRETKIDLAPLQVGLKSAEVHGHVALAELHHSS